MAIQDRQKESKKELGATPSSLVAAMCGCKNSTVFHATRTRWFTASALHTRVEERPHFGRQSIGALSTPPDQSNPPTWRMRLFTGHPKRWAMREAQTAPHAHCEIVFERHGRLSFGDGPIRSQPERVRHPPFDTNITRASRLCADESVPRQPSLRSIDHEGRMHRGASARSS